MLSRYRSCHTQITFRQLSMEILRKVESGIRTLNLFFFFQRIEAGADMWLSHSSPKRTQHQLWLPKGEGDRVTTEAEQPKAKAIAATSGDCSRHSAC